MLAGLSLGAVTHPDVLGHDPALQGPLLGLGSLGWRRILLTCVTIGLLGWRLGLSVGLLIFLVFLFLTLWGLLWFFCLVFGWGPWLLLHVLLGLSVLLTLSLFFLSPFVTALAALPDLAAAF